MDESDQIGHGGAMRRRAGLLVLAALVSLSGCADAREPTTDGSGFVGDRASRAPDAGVVGAFLSGRIAQEERDYPMALAFYQQALARDPDDPEITNSVLALALNEGRFDIAGPLAIRLADRADAPLAGLIQTVELTKAGKYDQALELADHLPKQGFQLFAGSFARAWLDAADPKRLDKAVAELNVFGQDKQMFGLRTIHMALIQDLAGDVAAADASYHALLAAGPPPRRLVELAGNFLERQGRTDEAKALYQRYADAGGDPTGVTPTLSLNGPPPRLVANVQDGFAEALFDLASLLSEADAPDVAMLSVRLALELQPKFPLAQIVLADVLMGQRRPREAIAVYQAVDPASPFAWAARLRAASSMETTGDKQGAEALMTAMAAERPDRAEPLIALGDSLRAREEFDRAAAAYSEALDRIGAKLDDRDWSLYFSRGICYERTGKWPAAEADLRKALAMQPKEAAVLNYLGYSLVDRKERLPEALKLIKQAVEISPSDGFIVDSLGWAYFRLGDYKNAQGTLERAVELQPADPEINDHLGDAYWQGGRHEEARLQWRRALDLQPTPDLAKQISAKLDHPPHAIPGGGAATASHGGG